MTQADDPRQVLCAGTALAFLWAAEEQGHRVGAAAYVERAGPLRAMEFVAGDGQQVASDLLNVNGQLARGLHRVRMEVDVGLPRDLPDLDHRLYCADLVIGHHDGDELRIWPQGPAHVIGVNYA